MGRGGGRRNSKTTKKKTVGRVKMGLQLSQEGKVKLAKPQFRAWEADEFLIKVFQQRGWKYIGEPCLNGREDYPQSMYDARDNKDFDKGPCLYWGDDYCGEALSGFSDKHLVSVIPNTHKALSKYDMQNMWGEYAWFPQCFTLPAEANELKKAVRESRPETTYWICKPPNSFGGQGMCVFKGGSREFNKLFNRRSKFVVQKYLHNPYLIGGMYKFHIRAYLLITNRSPLKAYLYKDGMLEFATVPYGLDSIEKKFNKYVHLTNYAINTQKQNMHNVCKDKPGVGIGSEWETKHLFKYLKENHPGFRGDGGFWKKLASISKVIAKTLMAHPKVESGCKNYNQTSHFELYGLDVMLDENLNMYITEANCQPGLQWSDPQLPNGQFNQRSAEINDLIANLLNDILTKLGADEKKEYKGSWITLH